MKEKRSIEAYLHVRMGMKDRSRPLIIGVDPAFRAGGFWVCLCDYAKETAYFIPYRDVLCWDRDLQISRGRLGDYDTRFIVEDSHLQNLNFAARSSSHQGIQARMGRNVGANQAASALAVQAIYDAGFGTACVQVTPFAKGKKLTDAEFRAIAPQDRIKTLSGYTGNQDQRDAFKLCGLGLHLAWKTPIAALSNNKLF